LDFAASLVSFTNRKLSRPDPSQMYKRKISD